jgi:hypothetical protein
MVEPTRIIRGGVRLSSGRFPYPLNRRREERIGFVAPLFIEDRHRDMEARSANVSAHGMLVRTTRALEKGSVVDLRFELPTGYPIRTSAVVVSSRGASASLHFPTLSHADRGRLRRFVVERRMRALPGRSRAAAPTRAGALQHLEGPGRPATRERVTGRER